MAVVPSQAWGNLRVVTGTILGGILGFYVMDRVEKRHKEKVKERLKKYEMELMKKEKQNHNQLEESL